MSVCNVKWLNFPRGLNVFPYIVDAYEAVLI